jgi:hypothetical protein
MDWIKLPIDSILYSEFKNSELIVLIKYQALYCQLEKEPSDAQLNRVFNKKELKLIQSYAEVVQELCQNQIVLVNKKRNRDKENYKQKQSLGENSASGPSTDRQRSGVADKNREDKKREDNIYTAEFDELWKEYPKQRAGNKQKAFNAYCRAMKRTGQESGFFLSAVRKYADSEEVKRGFAKGCEAWFNADKFNDNYDVEQSFVANDDDEKCWF